MRPFRFRAQAALQLRQREHDHALVHLAQAQGALLRAQRGADEAEFAVREADDRLRDAMRSPTAHTRVEWYRSWRLRCCAERDCRSEHRRACEADVQDAATAVRRAQQRVRSLERLRDLALAAWRRAAGQEEQKTMDALATSRFTKRKDAV